jgi:homocysteine S-methyltransferase
LFKTPEGVEALRKYFRSYASIASRYNAGLILESATWRANPDWGKKLGYSAADLSAANRKSIQLLEEIRSEFENEKRRAVISGCVGPRGDGYNPANLMSAADAESYHHQQIQTFADTAADMVTAITMNYVEEAIGIVQASRREKMPVVISFTVETDGKLPTGQSLKDAIEQVDRTTSGYCAYFMLNCAHPAHFQNVVAARESWLDRIHGLRANASRMSHAELNEAPELDSGNPAELGTDYAELKVKFLTQLNVLGGCCGTDHRHIEKIAGACAPLFSR